MCVCECVRACESACMRECVRVRVKIKRSVHTKYKIKEFCSNTHVRNEVSALILTSETRCLL